MKPYTKPTIEFIELRPEERLACDSNQYGSYKGCYYWLICKDAVPVWIFCDCLRNKYTSKWWGC
jgi:hypothetical protein